MSKKIEIMISCGDCPEWQDTEVGFCKLLKEPRHSRRELCPDVWETEVKRLGKIVKFTGNKLETILVLGRALNPRLAFEKAGVNFDKIKPAQGQKQVAQESDDAS